MDRPEPPAPPTPPMPPVDRPGPVRATGPLPRPNPDTARWRRAFTAYARWLDGISWKRFALLSLLVLILAGALQDIPPFNIPWGRDRTEYRETRGSGKGLPSAPIQIEGIKGSDGRRYEIRIDGQGVQVRPLPPSTPAVPVPPAPPAPPPAPPAPGAAPAVPSTSLGARERAALEEAQAEVAAREAGRAASAAESAAREALRAASQALGQAAGAGAGAGAAVVGDPTAREMAEALSEAREALQDAGILQDDTREEVHIRAYRLGDGLPQIAFLLIVLSAVIKIMATGRFRAEAQAEEATEKAESESLKRQVVEARMAAMQAQVEPHFLFNTLASIDHLIETDPPRASQMQRNLIALLRASMPSLREAGSAQPRELKRELDVIRPYIEILKVRMEDRLDAHIDVPEGLLSAEFPPMMIQGLVENAIKHGLEPKAEGGRLEVGASIEHGKLVVRVADTGLGFGRAATAGTGTGLANIRERLLLLYGAQASLTVTENRPSGTVVTLTLPYRSLHAAPATA